MGHDYANIAWPDHKSNGGISLARPFLSLAMYLPLAETDLQWGKRCRFDSVNSKPAHVHGRILYFISLFILGSLEQPGSWAPRALSRTRLKFDFRGKRKVMVKMPPVYMPFGPGF
jgi:hypothetical protein